MEQIEKKAEDAKANASNNRDEIEFNVLNERIKWESQFETISELESEVEELNNRSLRKTLIFKNIKNHQAYESSWSDTKSVLIDQISRVLPETTKEEILKNIERVHGVHSKGASSNEWPPNLVVKWSSGSSQKKLNQPSYRRIQMIDHRSSFLRCIVLERNFNFILCWHSALFSLLPCSYLCGL